MRVVDAGTRTDAERMALVDPTLPAVTGELVGTRLAHFRIEGVRGRGGMGIVYRAIDEQLGRTVALKVLPDEVAGDELRRRRFQREAKVAAAVNHPNIATVYEVGEADGRVFIAMEFVEGTSLRERMVDRRLTLAEALAIAGSILAGLARAHDAGITHRDLKPDNVMIASDGTVKVLDFGLATHETSALPIVEADTVTQAREGRIRGTPSYMSPEQARGAPIDHRSDLFSFGVMLYEMVTGERPFAGPTPTDVMSAILRDEPVPAHVRNPDVSAPLSAVIARCLAKDLDRRYPSCAALRAELTRAHDDITEPAPGRPSRRRAIVIGALGVAVAGGLAASLLVWRGDRSPAPAPRGLAITDAPTPRSDSREALAAYASALQAFRDSNFAGATDDLRRALALDPQLAAAHLRLALARFDMKAPASELGEHYNRAVRGRAQLDAKDRALLDALEPVLARAPPDRALAVERMRAVMAAYPTTAEVPWALALVAVNHDHDVSVGAARRAAQIDPTFADAWYLIGVGLGEQDRIEEATAAFDQCATISPAATDCMGGKASIEGNQGRCVAMEATLRRAFASNPTSETAEWGELRGMSLHALGKPAEVVLEAMRPRWKRPPNAPWRKLYDEARVATAWGDFEGAARLAAAGRQLVAEDPNAATHLRFVWLQIELAIEAGRVEDAGQLAKAFLERSELWLETDLRLDPTVYLLRTMRHAQMLSPDEFGARRLEWIARARPRYVGIAAPFLWLLADVAGATTSEEAIAALANLGGADPPKLGTSWLETDADIGRVLLLAGRVDEALPRLARLVRSCMELGAPLRFGRNLVVYGEALEAKGRRAEACAMYGRVLSRWDPDHSVTAARARTRRDALGCAPSP